jgi:hypothetical protein
VLTAILFVCIDVERMPITDGINIRVSQNALNMDVSTFNSRFQKKEQKSRKYITSYFTAMTPSSTRVLDSCEAGQITPRPEFVVCKKEMPVLESCVVALIAGRDL